MVFVAAGKKKMLATFRSVFIIVCGVFILKNSLKMYFELECENIYT
jgi:hypothetical protein